MLLKILLVVCCASLVRSDADHKLSAGVSDAIKNGVEKSMETTNSLVISGLEALSDAVEENRYHAKNKMKEFNGAEIKKHIAKGLRDKMIARKIMVYVKIAVCSKQKVAQERSIENAVTAFEDLLDNVRDTILNDASGKLLDSLESFVDTKGTGFDFSKEMSKEVDTIDDDGDITVLDFEKEIRELVKDFEGKSKSCDKKVSSGTNLIDISGHVDNLIDQVQNKLENIKKAAGV